TRGTGSGIYAAAQTSRAGTRGSSRSRVDSNTDTNFSATTTAQTVGATSGGTVTLLTSGGKGRAAGWVEGGEPPPARPASWSPTFGAPVDSPRAAVIAATRWSRARRATRI